MEHTPGPWQHYERADPDYPYGIRSQGGKNGEGSLHIASVRWTDIGEANAEFIVRAVNNHAALLEALERIVAERDKDMPSDFAIAAIIQEIDKARDAIEAAK